MAILFHDGTKDLYKAYCQNKAWNDPALLQLSKDNPTQARLQNFNDEETITGVLSEQKVKTHRLEGYVSSLKSYVEADEDTGSIIVVKGLHQPFSDKGRWKPHITIGLDAYLWHLYFTWTRNDALIFDSSSQGPQATGKTHDDWELVK